jgi:hypothetical protein
MSTARARALKLGTGGRGGGEVYYEGASDLCSELDRDGIAHLSGNRGERAVEYKIVGERLDACCLTRTECPILSGMSEAAV